VSRPPKVSQPKNQRGRFIALERSHVLRVGSPAPGTASELRAVARGCSSSDCSERRTGLFAALRASGSACEPSPVTET